MFTQLTEFIETLAEKHGYDVETMQDEWWGVQESDDHRCSARLSKKEEKVLCSYIFEHGKKIGQTCGTWVRNPNEISCTKHTSKRFEDEKIIKLHNKLIYGVSAIRRQRSKEDVESLTLVYEAGPVIYRSDKTRYDKFKPDVAEFLSTISREEFDKFIGYNEQTFIKVGDGEWSIPKIFRQGWTDSMSENLYQSNRSAQEKCRE